MYRLDDKNQMISYTLIKTQSESVSILEKVKQDEIFAKLSKELSIDKGVNSVSILCLIDRIA